jgi:hypothetical protein
MFSFHDGCRQTRSAFLASNVRLTIINQHSVLASTRMEDFYTSLARLVVSRLRQRRVQGIEYSVLRVLILSVHCRLIDLVGPKKQCLLLGLERVLVRSAVIQLWGRVTLNDDENVAPPFVAAEKSFLVVFCCQSKFAARVEMTRFDGARDAFGSPL